MSNNVIEDKCVCNRNSPVVDKLYDLSDDLTSTAHAGNHADVSFITELNAESSNRRDFCYRHVNPNFPNNVKAQTDSSFLVSSPSDDSARSQIKCVSVNVSGLRDKLRYGIIDKFLHTRDIICLFETNTDDPDLKHSLLESFRCIPKLKTKKSKYKYGGIHGMCMLFNPQFMKECKNVECVPDIEAECVLWVKIELNNGFSFIIGAVYMPCETSRFYFDEAFEQIEENIVDIKIRYDLPICLSGDFNAHTKSELDFIEHDGTVAELTGCDILDRNSNEVLTKQSPLLTAYRYSQDTSSINRNGRKLLALCKSLDFKIMNGRLGADKYLGKSTCFKTNAPSVIDYVIACDKMLNHMYDFDVSMFDECISDCHAPIDFIIFNQSYASEKVNDPSSTNGNVRFENPIMHKPLIFKWSKDEAKAFKEELHNENFDTLYIELDEVANNPTHDGIDNLCSHLNTVIIEVAKKAGAYKEKRANKSNISRNKRKSPPWFDKDCVTESKKYYRIKNRLIRDGHKKMAREKSRNFKRFIKTRQHAYFKQLNEKIRTLRSNNSKEYWNLLNKSTEGKQSVSKICLDTFMDHFKKLNQANTTNVDETNTVPSASDNEHNSILNELFTFDEIQKRIRKLKNNKSSGLDYIRNEFLKQSSVKHIHFYCKLFNLILQTALVPDIWCQGMIIPIYKNKGPQDNPDNYRGITLLSCLGKLFTACITERLANFMRDDSKMGYEQAGFRQEFSTLDHVFTLHAIIEYYKSKKGRLYCAFVDYSKAFDLIDRASLWLKMINNGVTGKILNVIQKMYENAKSCIRSSNNISEFFSCNQGVRQGENLSPLLFAIYLNDFRHFMGENNIGLKQLDEKIHEEMEMFMRLYVLLYADDTVILAETAEDLQKALHSLHDYCNKWNLHINISKTKIVIFSRGKVRKYPVFKIGLKEVDVTDSYIYLGVTFNYNGSFRKAIEKQIAQARRAMFLLLQKARILRLPIDIVLELFDICVVPVLLYGCEIWGFENLRDVNVFHRNFLRTVLKAFKCTPNCMLYGESNSVDMTTKVNIRIISFWNKINCSNISKLSTQMCHFLNKLYIDNPDDFNFKWSARIKQLLDNAGFSYVWNAQNLNSKHFVKVFKLRCNDMFLQNWNSELQCNSQCKTYKLIKEKPKIEEYLVTMDNAIKYKLLRFITRVHHLPATYNRYREENEYDTTCPLCPLGVLGDEIHYLFVCNYFNAERAIYLPKEIIDTYKENISLALKKIMYLNNNKITQVARFVKIVMKCFKNPNKNSTLRKQTRTEQCDSITRTKY